MRSRDIYRQTIQQTAAPRDVEYRLIAQVTSALIECEEIVGQAAADPRKMARLVEALNANKRMWDVFIE
ncbi:MAG: flagellar biosynthesis regulator FlaF, partial [Alphaproteobacteria bacterium]|nr:flagellar biosynthesis regulator FlaF [Alphaproteobacteria bacterium]